MPERIQRRRTKGWMMPENTVYVGRPTKWGNPFPIYNDRAKAVALFRTLALWWINNGDERVQILHGRNLACWCKEGEPCHADVLLELANQ